MRSDAIDRIVSTYLKQPVKLSWKGSIADPLRGRLEEVTLTLAGVATAWIALDEIVLGAAHVEITPGLPARISVQRPHVQLATVFLAHVLTNQLTPQSCATAEKMTRLLRIWRLASPSPEDAAPASCSSTSPWRAAVPRGR